VRILHLPFTGKKTAAFGIRNKGREKKKKKRKHTVPGALARGSEAKTTYTKSYSTISPGKKKKGGGNQQNRQNTEKKGLLPLMEKKGEGEGGSFP